MSVPQIVTTASGPAVFVEATGLGPTVPGVDPGQPFPADSQSQVNSPVDVTLNGRPAEVIDNIGWAGFVDTYRIDFRVPDGTTAGMASIQITAAWIAGPALRIAIQ
jgi:uncharacterized protein (TIGR03437 family)